MRASVIIPAHNEQAVIGSVLSELSPGACRGDWQVVVVCNGCTDNTAGVARAFPGIAVLEIEVGSKPAALNAGDEHAIGATRIYLDADITISQAAVALLINTLLGSGSPLTGRPPFRYNCDGASAPVRAFYRARNRIGSTQQHLWGAGVYAMNASARARFDRFPIITADDLYVDSLFSVAEKVIIDAAPVIVRTPRTTLALMKVLRRTYRGNSDLYRNADLPRKNQSSAKTFRELLRTTSTPREAWDSAVYLALVMYARSTGRHRIRWERDDSSRQFVHLPDGSNGEVMT